MLLLLIVCILGFGISGFFKRLGNNASKALFGSALGIIVFTQLVIFLSFIFNFSPVSIFLSLFILSFVSVFGIKKQTLHSEKLTIPKVYLFVSLVFLLLISVILISQTLYQTPDGLVTGGGGMFGDTSLHSAYTSRIGLGEFPPQNPLFAGTILVYPYANDLFSAVLRNFGMNFNLAFSIPQVIFTASFLFLFYKLATKFTSELGAVFALLILFLGWGFGWVYFLRDTSNLGGAFGTIATDYTDNSKYNLFFHNILTGLILPERSFLPGLVIGLLIFLCFFEYFDNRSFKNLLLAAILLGILPFWHTHTFIYFAIFSAIILTVVFINQKFKSLKFILAFVSIYVLLALPFFYLFFNNHSAQNFIRFTLGWKNADENIFLFWFKNSFLILPLAVAGFLTIEKKYWKFFIPAFLIFIVANVVIFQPWDWDNIKLLSWSFLFFSVLGGHFLKLIYKKGSAFRILLVTILMFSTLSGLLSLKFQLSSKYVAFDRSDLDLSSWIVKNTDENAVFISDPIPNNPISSLAGRMLYMGYPGHLWVHGIDYFQREEVNKSVLGGDITSTSLTEVPVSYIVLTSSDSGFYSYNQEPSYQNEKYKVFSANQSR